MVRGSASASMCRKGVGCGGPSPTKLTACFAQGWWHQAPPEAVHWAVGEHRVCPTLSSILWFYTPTILWSSAPGNVGKEALRKAVRWDNLNPSTTPCHKPIAPVGKDVPSSLMRNLTILGKLWDKEGNILASWRTVRNSHCCLRAWSSSHTMHKLCKEGLAVHCCICVPGPMCSCKHQCCEMCSIPMAHGSGHPSWCPEKRSEHRAGDLLTFSFPQVLTQCS